MSDALQCVYGAITGMFDLMDSLFSHFGVAPYLLGFFFIFTVCRLLLNPLIGGIYNAGVSDKVSQYKKTGKYRDKNNKGDSNHG